MSCSYFNNFGIITQSAKIRAIEEFATGKSLRHYKKKWVDERYQLNDGIEWAKRHVSVNYLDFIVNSYLAFVEPMRNLKNIKKLTKEKRKKLEEFFKTNRWNDFFKQVAKIRKYAGDVYVYWYMDENGAIRLKVLESENVVVRVDEDEKPFAYSYSKVVRYQERRETNSIDFMEKTKTIEWVFTKQGVDIFEDGILSDTILNKLELDGVIPIIHMQYGIQKNSPYSVIPAEELIDTILLLEKIDTEITHINTMAGAPQVIAIDAEFDSEHSVVGPNGIMYFDSVKPESKLEKANVARIQQIQITNGNEPHYRQKAEMLDMLYSKAKLIPPSIAGKVLSSDSSKVAQIVKQDMEYELWDFYTEFSTKFSPIINLLLNDSVDGTIAFEVPDVSITETQIDKYILKGYKMQMAELSMRDNLRLEGYDDVEIERKIKEWHDDEILKQEISGHNQKVAQESKQEFETKESEKEQKDVSKQLEQTSKKIPVSNNVK